MSYLTAKKLVAEQKLPIECRYLEGSRIAWRLAEYHLLSDEEILDKICIGGVHVTLRKLMLRGGLTEKEIEECVIDLGISEKLDIQMNYSETRNYREVLKTSSFFLKYVREHSVKAYDVTYEYLKQEGLLDDTSFAIVDSGWVGSMQQTLGHLIDKNVEGYYFGLYELPAGVDGALYHSFYFEPYKNIERKSRFNNCVFEAVFSSPEGMTCGYRKDGGRFYAVKESEKNENAESIEQNVKLLKVLLKDKVYRKENVKKGEKEVLKQLSDFMSLPSREEAEYIGSYRFSDDVNQESTQELAIEMDRSEINNTHILRRAMLMTGMLSGTLKDSAWLEGSIVRNGNHVNYHLWHCRWYKRLIYLRKRMKRRKV